MILLSREDFKKKVFTRDNNKCIVCGNPAVDAHHLLERKLWGNGGYYLENGVSLCSECHLKSEDTTYSCEFLREKAGISNIILPEHLSEDQEYDKWGNPLLPNGMRMKGELFEEASVQKILEPVLHLFVDRVKYPRTYHLPWSPGATSDDKILKDLSHFEGKEVIITVKMDGENTTLYKDGMHARSLDYESHSSRDWLRAYHSGFAHEIPEGFRLCGENLYALHSIHYSHLEEYFLLFSIWNKSRCLSWKETLEYAELLGLKTVPVLYSGIWDEDLIRNLEVKEHNGDLMEGYVVRLAEEFSYSGFRKSVAKWVRKNHVETNSHWKFQEVVPNLKENSK